MSYLGNTPTTQSFTSGTDYFNGTGSQTAFTLSRTVNSVNDIEVVINNVVQQPNTAYTLSGTTITFTSAPSSGTQNIYVRYLSTTTQVIAPSQNTVTYSTLDSNLQAKQGMSFKNRLINGACQIDQRNNGASITANDNTYAVDRFQFQCSQSSKMTATQGNTSGAALAAGFNKCLSVTSSSAYTLLTGDYFTVRQKIEGYNVVDLQFGTSSAKTITFSFWVFSSLTGTFGGAVQNSGAARSYPFTYTISSAYTWEYKTVTVAGDQSGTWGSTNGTGLILNFGLGVGTQYSGTANAWAGTDYESATGATSVVSTNAAQWAITGVQLEVGTQATNFDVRSYGTELQLCQRYCEVWTAVSSSLNELSTSVWGSSTNAHAPIMFTVAKRTTASVTLSAATDFYNEQVGVAWRQAGSVSVGGTITQYGFELQLNGLTGGTTGYAGTIAISNSGKIIASAEL